MHIALEYCDSVMIKSQQSVFSNAFKFFGAENFGYSS